MAGKNRNNLIMQMMIIYGVFILLPITLLFTLFSFRTVKDIEGNFSSFMRENNHQIEENINLIMADIDRISSLSVVDKDAQVILGKNYNTYGTERRADSLKMNKLISISSNLSPLFYEVIFVSNQGEIFTNLSPVPPVIGDKIQTEWIPGIDPEDRNRYISNIYVTANGVQYISVYRKILNSLSYRLNGYVFINIRLSELQKHFTRKGEEDEYSTNTLILYDQDIIFSTDTSQKTPDELTIKFNEAIRSNWDAIENAETTIKVNNQSYLVAGTKNETTGWYIIQYTPQTYIENYTIKALYYVFGSMIPIILLFVFFGYYFSKRIISPIHKLKCSMGKVEENIYEQVNSKEKMAEEIHELILSYNSMVTSLDRNIHQKYVLEMNKRLVEFKMLQAQINPHFLFNTLNLISSLAELEGVDKIKDVSNCLADMFRYSINSSDVVTIQEELNQIEHYVTIQKMRFYEKFDLHYEIAEEMKSYYMLKFLFQPLIENAIYHGLENKRGFGKIEMRFMEDNRDLSIHIIDDGIGMNEDTYQRVVRNLSSNRDDSDYQKTDEHIGLVNIHFRIKDYYGEEYGLSVHSTYGVGTDIEIRIPIIKEMR